MSSFREWSCWVIIVFYNYARHGSPSLSPVVHRTFLKIVGGGHIVMEVVLVHMPSVVLIDSYGDSCPSWYYWGKGWAKLTYHGASLGLKALWVGQVEDCCQGGG